MTNQQLFARIGEIYNPANDPNDKVRWDGELKQLLEEIVLHATALTARVETLEALLGVAQDSHFPSDPSPANGYGEIVFYNDAMQARVTVPASEAEIVLAYQGANVAAQKDGNSVFFGNAPGMTLTWNEQDGVFVINNYYIAGTLTVISPFEAIAVEVV